jgi:hypothetical protein
VVAGRTAAAEALSCKVVARVEDDASARSICKYKIFTRCVVNVASGCMHYWDAKT